MDKKSVQVDKDRVQTLTEIVTVLMWPEGRNRYQRLCELRAELRGLEKGN